MIDLPDALNDDDPMVAAVVSVVYHVMDRLVALRIVCDITGLGETETDVIRSVDDIARLHTAAEQFMDDPERALKETTGEVPADPFRMRFEADEYARGLFREARETAQLLVASTRMADVA